MKIKKTYTHSRVGLLVGLLSFHTLYSCVHTGRELGMGRGGSEQINKPPKSPEESKPLPQDPLIGYFQALGENPEKYASKKSCYKSRYFWVPVVVGGVGTAGYLIYKYGNMLSTGTPIENTLTNTTVSGGNATMAAMESNLALLGGVANTTVVPFIVNTTTTAATALTTLLPTAGLVTALRSNGSNVHDNSSSVTTTTPLTPTDKGTKNIASKSTPKSSNIKPIALTREVISDIRAHEFSISRMKYWHKKGLPIDAADPEEGRTLLIEAVNLNLLAQVKWLRINGANLDATDNRDNTALMYAIHNANKAEGKAKTEAKVIIDYLLKHGATPCTKNVDGRPLNADIKPLNNKGLSDAFEKC